MRARDVHRAFSGFAAGTLVYLGGFGCNPAELKQPETTYEWIGDGGGFRRMDCAGAWIYGTSVEPRVLDVWEWKDGGLNLLRQIAVEQGWRGTWAGDARLCYTIAGDAPAYVTVRDLKSDQVCERWPLPRGWYCSRLQLSRSGTHVAVCLSEELTDPPPNHDRQHPRLKVGLIAPEKLEFTWVATLIGRRIGVDTVRAALASDDGSYIAVAGWDNAVAMIDVTEQEVLWVRKPEGEIAASYVAFSPDASVVYAGGTKGAVYSMKTHTGETCGHWYATKSGQSEYGHRISCLAASPDGRWVAAGTGPEGEVYVGSVAEGRLVRILDHGGSIIRIVSFSPDSKSLATVAAGKIKVWNVSRWDQASTSPPPPPARQATTSPATTSGPSPRP